MDAAKDTLLSGRRRFLAGSLALGAAALLSPAMNGAARAAGMTRDATNGEGERESRMERRRLGGLEVSAIGLGCLPMVGYYGGKYEKKDMIALIRRAFDKGVTFFDTAEENFPGELQKELRRVFFYLNLNERQSLLLFQDVYCDYLLVANHLYTFLKRNYMVRIYLSVSRKFDGCECLPEILGQLEQQMEEKFYHPEKHIFSCEEEELKMVAGEVQDSQLMQMISEDISRKDTEQLWKHFECLKEKYSSNTQFSAMYIKFVFSNVIQELFQENQFADEHRLEQEIDRLYSCGNIMDILKVTEDNIREYEKFLERSMSESRNEVAAVKNYIYQHYGEDLNLEMLAEKVYLSSGYLSFIFKKETGMNLNRFIKVFRMEKAGEFLRDTNMKVAQISEKVGFANVSYFCRSFREYYGCSPESYRKGTGGDEEISSED